MACSVLTCLKIEPMASVNIRSKYKIAVFTSMENTRYYRGNSMSGTFRLGDRLIVVPATSVDIMVGDIIVFYRTNHVDEKDEIVHRVVAINNREYFTRGDNNLFCDLNPVQLEQIIGKVVMVENGGRKQVVMGGAWGLRRAKLKWTTLRLNRFARRLFQLPYNLLRNSQILSKLWRPIIMKIRLQTEDGLMVKYIYKHRTVAIWDLTRQRFDCRKPFDLVIPPPQNSKENANLD
jgi:signal peptidase I